MTVDNISFNKLEMLLGFRSVGIHFFFLTTIKRTGNRCQFYYPKNKNKNRKAVLFYYYDYYYFAVHFVTIRIHDCNTLLFSLCPMAQRADLQVPLTTANLS